MGKRNLRRLAVIALLVTPTSFAEAKELTLPGPWPQHHKPAAAVRNQQCEGCHREIAQEWRDSYHRRANTDPAFQRALGREPVPFCRRCHAPEADPGSAATGWAADSEVACVTCHELDGQIASGNGSGAANGKLPHPLRRDARLSGEDACLRCHEFQFPDGQWRRRPGFMQLTISEHRASPYAATACVECHMPPVPSRSGGTHRSHAFLGGHDEQMVRRSLQVEALRTGAEVVLRLTPQRVGHAWPTGDLFRRLVLTLSADGEPTVPAQQRYLMRHFESQQELPGHPVRVVQSDDRLTGPTEQRFAIPPQAVERPLRFRVTYQRVAFPIDQRGGKAMLDGEVLVASGVLPAARN